MDKPKNGTPATLGRMVLIRYNLFQALMLPLCWCHDPQWFETFPSSDQIMSYSQLRESKNLILASTFYERHVPPTSVKMPRSNQKKDIQSQIVTATYPFSATQSPTEPQSSPSPPTHPPPVSMTMASANRCVFGWCAAPAPRRCPSSSWPAAHRCSLPARWSRRVTNMVKAWENMRKLIDS